MAVHRFNGGTVIDCTLRVPDTVAVKIDTALRERKRKDRLATRSTIIAEWLSAYAGETEVYGQS
jgi:hypothetical protein